MSMSKSPTMAGNLEENLILRVGYFPVIRQIQQEKGGVWGWTLDLHSGTEAYNQLVRGPSYLPPRQDGKAIRRGERPWRGF